MRLIVSTCGTSILTNGTDNETRGLINRLANHQDVELASKDRQVLEQHIQNRQQRIVDEEDTRQVKRHSAELSGILTYYGDDLESAGARRDHHVLITSHTYLGQRVGEIIASWMVSRGLTVDVWSLSGLATQNRDDFRLAMAELVRKSEEILPGYRDGGYHIAFNLTGGFKSVQGFMQTLGMFYADESFYIFETGSLLTIPRLPIKLDAEGMIKEHNAAFRRMGLGEILPSHEVEGIPETMLFEVDQEACLSDWGTLVWERSKKGFYGKSLLEPLPGLRYSSNLRKKLNLSPDRLATLNERFDRLSLVIRDKGENLKGLDFKQLKGDPRPPSTHECDLWSKDERRGFGHYEEDVFVLDDIARGLH